MSKTGPSPRQSFQKDTMLKSALLAVVTLVLSVPVASAAVLQIDSSGMLTGATGVNVGGTLFDVVFVDDASCATLYSGCDEDTDFVVDGAAASDALLAQVLVDGPRGNFDSFPHLIFGCSDTVVCQVSTPEAVGPSPGSMYVSAAINFAAGSGGTDHYTGGDRSIMQPSSSDDEVYALWTRAAVPEPSAIALLGIGLACGLGARRWRRRIP